MVHLLGNGPFPERVGSSIRKWTLSSSAEERVGSSIRKGYKMSSFEEIRPKFDISSKVESGSFRRDLPPPRLWRGSSPSVRLTGFSKVGMLGHLIRTRQLWN